MLQPPFFQLNKLHAERPVIIDNYQCRHAGVWSIGIILIKNWARLIKTTGDLDWRGSTLFHAPVSEILTVVLSVFIGVSRSSDVIFTPTVCSNFCARFPPSRVVLTCCVTMLSVRIASFVLVVAVVSRVAAVKLNTMLCSIGQQVTSVANARESLTTTGCTWFGQFKGHIVGWGAHSMRHWTDSGQMHLSPGIGIMCYVSMMPTCPSRRYAHRECRGVPADIR